jgi:hypothetical protein
MFTERMVGFVIPRKTRHAHYGDLEHAYALAAVFRAVRVDRYMNVIKFSAFIVVLKRYAAPVIAFVFGIIKIRGKMLPYAFVIVC